ncbi:MAG: SPOR domain-containing protein [Bacteroidia bacterium]|nr:SPOR domain-containing protein [Bacteroidia bacterium]
MEVNKFIYELLFQYDCVILPDFGGFIANYRSAEIHPKFNTFTPPGKNILFNRNLVHNDGLLVSYIARIENLEYLASKNIVVGFVRETLRKLEKGERVTFEGIGVFYFDKQRNLQFEPDSSTNFLLDAFGLPTFRFPGIREHNTERQIRRKVSGSGKPRPPIHKVTARKVLIGLPLVIALIVIPVRSTINRNSSLSSIIPLPSYRVTLVQPVKDKTSGDSTNLVPESVNAASLPSQNNIQEKSALAPKTEVPVLTAHHVTGDRRFYVVAGSFKSNKGAQKLSDELSALGSNPVILEPDNGRIRIAVFSSTDRQEAIQKLNSLKPEHPDYWLLAK